MAFRLDKLTVKSQEAVQRAQSLAGDKGHPEMDPLHLLAALIEDQEGVARPILEKIGVSIPQLQRLVAAELDRKPQVSGGLHPLGDRPLLSGPGAAPKKATAGKGEFG